MKTPSDASAIPAEMLSKLHAVLRRERLVRLQAGLTRACAVLLTAMLAMMAVDWLAAPHESHWRWFMTISALACGGAALLIGCTIPFLRQRSLQSIAQQVDRSHPSLQERCLTTAELAQSKDQPEIRGSEGMIRKVAQQMADMSGSVVPGAVVSKQGLIGAGKFFAASATVLAIFFVADFPRAKVLSERFFQPGTDITLTRVQSTTGDVVVGKGENVTLEFTATGRAPDSAKLLLHPSAGPDEVVALEKAARESAPGASKFVYTANSVTASFDYSARAGDGRTAVNHVTVLERPALAEVQFRIEAPAYSRLPLVSQTSLPRQARALEGSRLEISFLPSQELASMELRFSDGATQRLEKSGDQRYHFSAVLSNTFAFEPVLTNPRHLDNQSPPNCQILVYQDQPPTVNITSPSDEISARPDDKIEIKFQARDDFGLARAELVVSVASENGSNSPPVTFPIPLDTNELGSKFIQKSVELDLAQFSLKQDQALDYSVRVTDTKNDSSFSTPLPDADAAAARQAQNSALASAQNQNSQANGSQNQGQQNSARNPADQNNSTNQSGSDLAQNQSPQNGGQNQFQRNTAQNQAGQNNGQNQSQRDMAQNQAGQNNGQNQSQANMAQNQSGQNNGQNQSQRDMAQNQAGQNNGQNQSQRDMAQNQAGQNNGQNQSQPNTGQNQSGQNNGQNQSQRDMAQNQSGQNNSQSPSTPNVARIQSPQNGGQNQSQPNMAQNQSGQNQSGQNQSGQNQSGQNSAQNQQQQNNGQNQDNAQNQSRQNQSGQNTAQNQSRQNNGQNQNQQQNQNSTPPQNNMSKRNLDVAGGQTSSAQQMHIQVDEFARSFEGQMREKQEMAIDPTLKRLDELLRKARDLTETNLLAAQSTNGLGVEQTWALDESKDLVRQADRAVLDLKKDSAGTAYAFIGLQVSDIGEMHIAPALEELGEVTLEPAHLKEDRDDLGHASFHLDQARKMLAALTKSYEEVKRDNKLADAMQQLKKMHQIFLEDTQAMLGSKKPPVNNNQIQRKIAEVDDDYAAKLNDLLQEQKKIMAELAKILADDPRLLRRFMAMQQQDTATLRDQMTQLAQRQKALATQTAEWTAASETNRPALAGQYLTAQTPEQVEISSLAAKLHENMITWLPDGVEQDKEPIATALTLAAEGARLAALAASQASPANMTNSLDSARKALDQFRYLHEYLPDMAGDTNAETDTDNLGIFTANRLNETGDLVTKESGWIKKMESLRDGDFSQSARVDEHQLALDTATLSDKLDAAVPEYAAISPEIQAKSDQLLHTVQRQVLPEETRAEDALARNTLKVAVTRQEGASAAFAQAETQFDDLFKLIVAKLDSAPPPDDPGENPTLDQMLSMLQQEKKAAESLGIPNRPLNIQIMTDWLRQNSSSQQAGSQQSGGQRQGQGNRAQARSAQQQARDNAARAGRASDQARRNAQGRAGELAQSSIPGPGNTNEGGPKSPSNAWNTLASKLGDELRQSRDNVPPEQYRQAIEQYFNSISETVPASPAPPANPNGTLP